MLEGKKCLWAQEADYQEKAMAEAEARLQDYQDAADVLDKEMA